MIDFGRANTLEERTEVARFFYSVYVEELGRFRDVADHGKGELRDPEDAYSWLFVARDDGKIIGACRVTWGGDGVSDRQIRQYCLEPFLTEMPAEQIAVGERTMLAPAYRGGSVYGDLARSTAPLVEEHGVSLVFGACEPHLVPMYASLGQRPYAPRNFFSEESGYLIPNAAIVADLLEARAARQTPQHGVPFDWFTWSGYRNLPPGVRRFLETFGTVWTGACQGESAYREQLAQELARVPAQRNTLFDGVSEVGVDRCTAGSLIIECRAGDHVIKREGTARNPYLVLAGELQARDGDRVIRTLMPGDLFGEAGALLRSPRAADVFVISDTARILSFNDKALRRAIGEADDDGRALLSNLVTLLAARLRDAGALTG